METLVKIIRNLYIKLLLWVKKIMNNLALFSSLNTTSASPSPSASYLVIGSTLSSLYDPITDTFNSGPTPLTTTSVDYFYITSGVNTGKYLIISNNSTSTYLYNPLDSSFSAGPSFSATAQNTSRNFNILSGTYSGYTCVIRGRDFNTTELYNPTTGTFIAGPSLPANVGSSVRVFPVTSGPQAGNVIVIRGANTNNTYIYDCSTSSFIAGPNLTVSPANVLRGGMNFSVTDGRLISAGSAFNGNTSIYNEGSNSFSAGPSYNGSRIIGNYLTASTFTTGSESGNEIIFTSENTNLPGFFIYNRTSNTFGNKINSTGGGSDATISSRALFLIDSGIRESKFIYLSSTHLFEIDQNNITMSLVGTVPFIPLIGIKHI